MPNHPTVPRILRGLGAAAIFVGLQAGAAEPAVSAPRGGAAMHTVSQTPFGTLPDGRAVSLYTLRVPGGWQATITDYGAILTSFLVPSRTPGSDPVDVVLGFDSVDGYVKGHPYFGATVGRVGNRIAAGKFTLDGKEYRLATNNGPNHLHGGTVGFDKILWKATPEPADPRGPSVVFTMVSADGDEGYPGRLAATTRYTLTPAGELRVEMTATAAAPTICNIVHHSYWNLGGHAAGDVRGHDLTVVADTYLPVDAGSIPTGQFAAVAGTPFDLRPERQPPVALGAAIAALPGAGTDPGGIDHNFLIRGWQPDGQLRPVAVLVDPASGRRMELLADQPGVQVYTGNYLDGTVTGKGGAVYRKHGGVCLETQKYPDAIHHAGDPRWPSPRVEPGQTYRHVMIHRFTP